MRRPRDLPDWRDAGAYSFLLKAERPGFAWEWLRRLPGYRAAAVRTRATRLQPALRILPEQPAAARWGLHLFEDPALTAAEARPIWRSDRHAFVLAASAEASSLDPDAFALERFCHLATLAGIPGVEHLLLSDGYRSIRLDVRGASLLSGPARLRYEVSGIRTAKSVLPVLQRFLALASTNQFSPSLHSPDSRARRQVMLLRTFDALMADAGQRTIAAELLSSSASESRWRLNSPSLRSQVQRLVQGARAMAQGGFWNLLQ